MRRTAGKCTALLGAETSAGYVVAVAVDDPDGVAWTPVAALPGC